MRGLDGRVVLVTGAASGIGRATAERLVAERAAVALVDRDAERLTHLARTLADTGGRVVVIRAALRHLARDGGATAR